MIVRNFWRSWSWIAASIGLVLPELLSLIASNSDLIPYLDAEATDAIRLVCLVLVVVLRPIPQKALRND
ncbi:hypothetical protein [Variovorax sp. RO1]|uniref:hypothetical protein n=1 Tax=Variovorax sp. RO1 TaxID=2066034 RepID=UPI000C717D4C|nr:hypothetical protein [Variovorax sp. RO1]